MDHMRDEREDKVPSVFIKDSKTTILSNKV